MMKYLLLLLFCPLLAWAQQVDKRQRVRLETDRGNITIALYDETPGHRDNFLRLVREGFYDSLLFHRVIEDFMIQTGTPIRVRHSRVPNWVTADPVTTCLPKSVCPSCFTVAVRWRQPANPTT